MPAPAAIATSGADEPRAGGQQQRALPAVASRADARSATARRGLRPISANVAVALHLLDRHHRIAAARQHRARHDLDAGVAGRRASAADRRPPACLRCAGGRRCGARRCSTARCRPSPRDRTAAGRAPRRCSRAAPRPRTASAATIRSAGT